MAYISKLNHPWLVEHDFPLTEFVCETAHVTQAMLTTATTFMVSSHKRLPEANIRLTR